MESRNHVYEGLSKYSDDQEKIQLTILEIGEDPDAEEYPDGTLQKGITFFSSLGEATAKALESGREDKAIAVQENMMPLLEKAGIPFPPEIVLLFAEAAVQEGSSIALGIQSLRKASYERQRKAGDVQFAHEVLKDMGVNSSVLREVFNPESIQAFIEAEVEDVPDWDTGRLLAGLNKQREDRQHLQPAKEQRAALPAAKVDVKKWLAVRKGA